MEKIPIRHINTFQTEPGLSEGFSIRNVETLLSGKDMVQELHRHDYFYILILKKGTGNHEIDFTPYKIRGNSVFIMRPGQVHRLVLKAASKGYLMQFTDEFYSSHDKTSSQLLRKVGNGNHYQLNTASFQKLLTILTHIVQEYTDKQENYHEVVRANMGIFFIGLARLYNKRASEPVNLYTNERFEEFLELLDTHIFSHKMVSEYAAMMNISSYQLNAVARGTIGKTCSQIINEHIILEAKRRLLATSNQVNQIANHLGYEDVSYFIRFFKKHTGHSPDTFRHNFK